MAAKPAPAPARSADVKPASPAIDQNELMLGGGALALLALGGAAYGLSRRRRNRELFEEETAQPTFVEASEASAPVARHDPIESWSPAIAPAAAGASAFAWGDRTSRSVDAQRKDGETWVERAYRGPTPDNPSLSLRKRLKRAAFFDKREREAAAGRAQPVEPDAGLPEAVSEERVLEAA